MMQQAPPPAIIVEEEEGEEDLPRFGDVELQVASYRDIKTPDFAAVAAALEGGLLPVGIDTLGRARWSHAEIHQFLSALEAGAGARLRVLRLRGNTLNDIGAVRLASAMANGKLRDLEQISLAHNRLTKRGAARLSDAAKACPNLTVFDLAPHTYVGAAAATRRKRSSVRPSRRTSASAFAVHTVPARRHSHHPGASSRRIKRSSVASALFVVSLLGVSGVAIASSNPPPLPEYWSAEAIQYISDPNIPPPFTNTSGVPPRPRTEGRLHSVYDWSRRAMIEHYLDACVPIFPRGDTFECTFLNVNDTAFLITYDDSRPPWLPTPCCVFRRPHHPPTPTFLDDLNKTELPSPSPINGSAARWWRVDIPPPMGPFFYAWTTPFRPGEQIYAAFDFPGVVANSGGRWAVQNFQNVTLERPPASTWKLPAACGSESAVPMCPTDLLTATATSPTPTIEESKCKWIPAPVPATYLNTSSSLANASEGITNDDVNFFFNSVDEMWRADPRKGYAVTRHAKGIVPEALREGGYTHMGDTAYLSAADAQAAGVASAAVLLAPLSGYPHPSPPPMIAAFYASNFSFAGWSCLLPNQTLTPWVAVEPGTTFLFSSDYFVAGAIHVYDYSKRTAGGHCAFVRSVPVKGALIVGAQGGAWGGGVGASRAPRALFVSDDAGSVFAVNTTSGRAELAAHRSLLPVPYEMEGVAMMDLRDIGEGLLHFFDGDLFHAPRTVWHFDLEC